MLAIFCLYMFHYNSTHKSRYKRKIKDQTQPANFANSNAPRRRAPGFLMRPATTRLKPGSKLSLSAKLLGHPAPKVTWEKDGQVINELTDRLHIFNIENLHNLEIESVNYTDGGVYRIIARNALGRQQAQEKGLI